MPNINTLYSENAREITVTVTKDKKPVAKIVTDKASGLTTTEVYKEGIKFPIERYVYNKLV